MEDNLRLDELPNGALVVRAGIVLHANSRAAQELGVPDGAGLAGSMLTDHLDPQDEAAVTETLESGEARTITARRRVELGWRTVELAMSPSGEDVIVAVRDVTDAVRMAIAVDRLADGTCSINPDALVDWAAPDSARLIETDAVTTNALLDRVHPEDLPTVLDAVARSRAEAGHRERIRLRWRLPSDGDEWVDEEVVVYGDLDNPDLRGTFIQRRRPRPGEQGTLAPRGIGGIQSLAEAAPIGIVVAGPAGRTLYCNLLAERVLGPLAQVLGETEWIDAARAEQRDALHRVLEGALHEGTSDNTVAAFDQPDGTTRWLRVNAAPRRTDDGIHSGWIATLEDVTETVEARAQADRLAHLLDAGSDFVIIARADGPIVYVNDAARFQLRLSPASEGGTSTLRDVLTEPSKERYDQEALPHMLGEGTWSGEMTLLLADVAELPVSMLGVTRYTDAGDVDTIAFTARDIVALKAAEMRMRYLASHDVLTGLPNRSLLADRLEQSLRRHRRHGWGVAVMFCDLDGFKSVNDEHGHEAGDTVLAAAAQRMRATVRETDTVARLGGDEFVVLCEGAVSSEDLGRIAQRLVEAVSAPVAFGSHRLSVGVSIGVAVAGPDCDTYDGLMTFADVAMYRAKAHGKGRYEIAATAPGR